MTTYQAANLLLLEVRHEKVHEKIYRLYSGNIVYGFLSFGRSYRSEPCIVYDPDMDLG